MPIAVLYGFILFKESGIGERFLGAGVMLVGFVLLAFCDLRNSTNRSLLLSDVPAEHEQPLFLSLRR